MIISASRRTDIPSFFSDWLIKRIEEGFAYVRNPVNMHQISKIVLSPDVVDCIVFWSKNPGPMLDKLDKLNDYLYYFQFTLNAYETEIEGNLPPLEERIGVFQRLSDSLGTQRVIWRYDPIILNENYTVQWHLARFSWLAQRLCNYTEKCTISFIDCYPGIAKSIAGLGIRQLTRGEKTDLAEGLSSIARSHNLRIDTCAEDLDLSLFGMEHARCIDDRLIARLSDCPLDVDQDKNQRLICGCASSVDLGLYNTCANGCVYCYANHSAKIQARNLLSYDENSPLLCSCLTEADKLSERKVKSHKTMQLTFSSDMNLD